MSGITRVAAYALCTDERDHVLLCRVAQPERDAGCWTLPGGGLDFGEDPATAALRELAEETGLTGRITRIAAIDSRHYPPAAWRAQEFHAIRILYDVEITGGTLTDEVSGSTDRAIWFPPADARRLPLVELADVALDLLDRRTDTG